MILYAFSVFLSAFLLFQIQPMIAKYILPWFGGTPTVWSTVMLFFQALLTGGYAYGRTPDCSIPKLWYNFGPDAKSVPGIGASHE